MYRVYGKSGLGLFEVHTDDSNLQLFPFYTTRNGGGSPDGLLLASDGNFCVDPVVVVTSIRPAIRSGPTGVALPPKAEKFENRLLGPTNLSWVRPGDMGYRMYRLHG
jgi:hypothetical protein